MYEGVRFAGYYLFFVLGCGQASAANALSFPAGADCEHWYACAYNNPANRNRVVTKLKQTSECNDFVVQYAMALAQTRQMPPHYCHDEELNLLVKGNNCVAPVGVMAACNHAPPITHLDTLFYGIIGGVAIFFNVTSLILLGKQNIVGTLLGSAV
jgi:hypothetical protein